MGAVREIPSEPDAEVVSLLRDLLARAERGELRAVAVAGHGAGPDTVSAYALGSRGDLAHLVCAMERVKLRLLLRD